MLHRRCVQEQFCIKEDFDEYDDILNSEYEPVIPKLSEGLTGKMSHSVPVPVLLSHGTQGRLAAQQYRGLMKNY